VLLNRTKTLNLAILALLFWIIASFSNRKGILKSCVVGLWLSEALSFTLTKGLLFCFKKEWEFWKGSGENSYMTITASSYVTKYYFLIYCIRRALPHIWLCTRSLQNFLYTYIREMFPNFSSVYEYIVSFHIPPGRSGVHLSYRRGSLAQSSYF
jgi:hypothetical protein